MAGNLFLLCPRRYVRGGQITFIVIAISVILGDMEELYPRKVHGIGNRGWICKIQIIILLQVGMAFEDFEVGFVFSSAAFLLFHR